MQWLHRSGIHQSRNWQRYNLDFPRLTVSVVVLRRCCSIILGSSVCMR